MMLSSHKITLRPFPGIQVALLWKRGRDAFKTSILEIPMCRLEGSLDTVICLLPNIYV
jgi:hypothetical protein